MSTRPCSACGMLTPPGRECGWCGDVKRPPGRVRRLAARGHRLVRIGRRCVTDRRVPRALRWFILAGIVAGPFIVGPLDEILVAGALAFLVWRYPAVWREHSQAVDAS